ncbi:DUF559 domain-containing protein [Arthrobacter sp. KK5.5]|uniref:DUF559 domain-containing protein n=1 Tax=Arthrobacter sp. KK5.5 TaxID=3373084 RepID=UPI003EE5FCF4
MGERLVDPDAREAWGLPRRAPKPEVTVAAVRPEVLDLWSDERFGPWDLASTSPLKVLWRCPAGHRFLESPNVQCGSVAAWRNQAGGSRACWECWCATLPPGTDPPTRKTHGGTPPPKVRTPKYPVGTVVPSKSRAGSSLERAVEAKLRAAGIPLRKERLSVQCGYEPVRGNHPLITPDYMVRSANVCIEVDPAYTHRGDEVTDRRRNTLLEEAGWVVVRLRMGGLEPLGAHDVVASSDHLTQAAVVALVDAVCDAVVGRPATVRRVAAKPVAPRAKSPLGAVGAHKYFDRAHYVSWTTAAGEVVRLVAMGDGAYLAAQSGWGFPLYVCDLGLEDVPRAQWRGRLLEVLSAREAGAGFFPMSRYPWGDKLFTGPQAGAVNVPDKFDPTADRWEGTANLEGVDELDGTDLRGDGAVLAALDPGAAAYGWRIAHLEHATGYRGPYQRVLLERDTG